MRTKNNVRLIETLFKRAVKYGYSSLYRNGELVFELTYQKSKITLCHYGTTTLVYDTKKSEINYYYGLGASDRDAMNTILNIVNHDEKQFFRYGSCLGFILEGEKEHDFIDDFLSDNDVVLP